MRQPGPCVRAFCESGVLFHMSHLKLHFALHTSHSTLHTALFTPHTSHCTLHTLHFISPELFSPYPSSSLLISSLLICHLSFHESLPSTTSTRELACAVRQPGPCVRALCEAVTDVKSHTKVSHHPSLSVFLCDVKSHTTLH